ncbi:hypothetical protein CTheo_4934 [Ceratobasidium theobromae]|uniref:Uncharacterized protein n=1 Tax=Ceratobasidium theobromae TaxID=1582974 RepID=A0A5N5QJ20_9AGAM|nr:hypothetical protein CTheo_4934 [Ceratobasidium theobromae]
MQTVSQQSIPTPHMHSVCSSFLEEYEDRIRSSGGDQSTKAQLEVLCEALREEAVGVASQQVVAFRQ